MERSASGGPREPAPSEHVAAAAVERFFSGVRDLLDCLRRTQSGSIEKAALLMADCIQRGGVVHVFGAGHSHVLAEEMFWRAGGLAAVDAILDESCMLHHGVTRQTLFERLPGCAEAILAGHELRAGDVMLVISSSGRNALPVEVAGRARREGLPVIALTSAGADRSWAPATRGTEPAVADRSGRWYSENVLARLADVVLDNCGLPGDAAFSVCGSDGVGRVCPTSTIAGAVLLQACILATIEILAARGVEVPVLTSANVEGGPERNAALLARYRDRVRLL